MGQDISRVSSENEYIRCYSCGHIDYLEYCSNCGHQLINPTEKVGVLPFMIEIIRDIFSPLMTGITTFFMFIFRPKNVYEAIFLGTDTTSKALTIENITLPLITFFWKKILNKKQNIFTPSGYLIFVIIVFLYINEIYSNLFFISLQAWSESPLILNDIIEQAQKGVRILGTFTAVLLTCMFFAVLIKSLHKQLTWVNAYALSIYTNSTNILTFIIWAVALSVVSQIFPENYIVDFLAFLIITPIFFIAFVLHGIVAPTISISKIFNVSTARLLFSLILGYISFPIILLASIFLTYIVYLIVKFPVMLIVEGNAALRICCAGFIFVPVALYYLVKKIRYATPKA